MAILEHVADAYCSSTQHTCHTIPVRLEPLHEFCVVQGSALNQLGYLNMLQAADSCIRRNHLTPGTSSKAWMQITGLLTCLLDIPYLVIIWAVTRCWQQQ
jgi:hypothetical protein